MKTIDNYDAALKLAGEELEDIPGLWHWSTNYDYNQTNPWLVFLTLTGQDQDIFGENLTTKFDLDFVSCDYLADALKLWATRPNDVRRIVLALIAGESDDD